jgi:hypothetical protein
VTRIRSAQQATATVFCAKARCDREAEPDSPWCLSHLILERDRARAKANDPLRANGSAAQATRTRKPTVVPSQPSKPPASPSRPPKPVRYALRAGELLQLGERLDLLIAENAAAQDDVGKLQAEWKRLCYDLAVCEHGR